MKYGQLKMLVKPILILLIIFASCAVIAKDGPHISFVKIEHPVKQFDILELDIDTKGVFDNPFDPNQVDIKAHFISPNQNELIIPAFYYQGFSRDLSEGREILEAVGSPQWKVRFTPREIGIYRVFLTAQFGKRKLRTKEETFNVTKSIKPGFLRASSTPYLFFDSGEIYFGIGENVGWTDRKQTYAYDSYFEKLSDNGCNIVRIWMVSWNLALEWAKNNVSKEGFSGLGRYNLRNAWRLDHILKEADKKGLYVILVLGNYKELAAHKIFWGVPEWGRNPYNASNGGPCVSPAEFWTNENAQEYYKKRLRYIVARWGAYKNLLAFELWNETNAPVFWVKEMSEYIKDIDPHGHLVTTSIGMLEFNGFNEDEIWKLPSIDFSQVHIYGRRGAFCDLVDTINYKTMQYVTKYRKPSLIGEYGIDSTKSDKFYDTVGNGIHIHNCLWAGLFSQALGGAMNWWWDDYINQKNLYEHYKTFSLFVKNLNLPRNGWGRAKFHVYPEDNVHQGAIGNRDVSIPVADDWGNEDDREIEALNNGTLKGGKLNMYLHGMDKQDIRVCPVFRVNYPRKGEFIITVDQVSVRAVLNVYVDGQKMFSREFPGETPEGKGNWKRRRYRDEWGIYQYDYMEDCKINIPQGEHIIRLENVGKDWLSIKKVVLTNYKKGSSMDIRVLGLQCGKEAIFWIQNKESNWYNSYKGIKPQEVKGATLEVLDLPNGEYSIEWWDTWKARPLYREKAVSSGKGMAIKVPSFEKDVALRISGVQ
ncbi:MAG: cellulase family glycosylhydrolase [Candidatus Omnitrophica bacterium]|nr:cellulase family glycosylhydrolase [Candidatus Omnitrophota bacterium]